MFYYVGLIQNFIILCRVLKKFGIYNVFKSICKYWYNKSTASSLCLIIPISYATRFSSPAVSKRNMREWERWCSFLQGAIKTRPGWVPTRGSCAIFSHHTVESLPPTANSVLFVFLTYKPFAFQDSQSTAFTWSSQKTAHFLWKHCSLSNHELFTYPTCQASKSTSDFFPWWRRKTFSIFMCISFGQCKKVSRGVQKCWRI